MFLPIPLKSDLFPELLKTYLTFQEALESLTIDEQTILKCQY
jgi:hypothetical protein